MNASGFIVVYKGIMNWIKEARCQLCLNKMWGDSDRQLLLDLLAEIDEVLVSLTDNQSSSGLNQYSHLYAGTILSDDIADLIPDQEQLETLRNIKLDLSSHELPVRDTKRRKLAGENGTGTMEHSNSGESVEEEEGPNTHPVVVIEAKEKEKEPKMKRSAGNKRRKEEISVEETVDTIAISKEKVSSIPGKKGYLPLLSKLKDIEHRLPNSLVLLIDFWVRGIRLLLRRLDDLKWWAEPAQLLISRLNAISANGGSGSYYQRIEVLLEMADKYGISCKHVTTLVDWKKQEQAWVAMAKDIFQRKHLLKLEALKEFIKAGDRLAIILNSEGKEMLVSLKSEVRLASKWLQRFQKHSADEVSGLLSEAGEICVDLNEQVESMSLLSKTYCLCRNLYHGQMVGCDLCDDWYHLFCVGISVSQAEKSDKYVCIRSASMIYRIAT